MFTKRGVSIMFHQQSVRALYTRRLLIGFILAAEVLGILITAVYLTKANPATTGGPDAFGYTFIDSNEPGSPLYAWEEISPTGTIITSWTSLYDGFSGPISIGFPFYYYDNAYSELYISTEGYISFGRGYYYTPSCCELPSPSLPNNDIAIFGENLHLVQYGTESAVYYQTLSNPNRLVIEFVNVYFCCGYPPPYAGITYQLILYENGDILAQYKTLRDNTAYYIGIENEDGTDGLSYTASLADNLAILYHYPTNVFLNASPESGYSDPGTTFTYTVSINNQTGITDSFDLVLAPGNLWTTTLPISQVALADGEVASIEILVQIPPSTEPGDSDTATLQATSITNPGTYSDTLTFSTRASGGEIAYVAVSSYNYNYIALIDTAIQMVVDTIDLSFTNCNEAEYVSIPPDGQTVWVSCPFSNNIVIINRNTNTIANIIYGPYTPNKVAFSTDGQYAFVGSIQSSQVSIINTTTYAQSLIFAGYQTEVVAHPYLPVAYITNGDYLSIDILDTTSLSIIGSIDIPSFAYAPVVSPDGSRLYIRGNGEILSIDTQTRQVVDSVSYFGPVADISVSKDNSQLFVSTDYNQTIEVIDAATLEFIETIYVDPTWQLFREPGWMDQTCDGEQLFVTSSDDYYNASAHQVAAINTAIYTVTGMTQMPDLNGDNYFDTSTGGIVICPQYVASGVFLSPLVQTNSGGRGQVVAHQETLFNSSGQTDTFTLALEGGNWDSSLSNAVVGPLDDGEQITFTVYVTVPTGVDWYETDPVTVTATSVTSPTVYSSTAILTTEAYAPPAIGVSPTFFTATQLVNTVTTQTMTISNGNGVTLTYFIGENDTTQPPYFGSVLATGERKEWDIPLTPAEVTLVPTTPFDGNLPVILTDPTGDGGPADLISASGLSIGNNLDIQLTFAPTVNPLAVNGYTLLDTDQNILTGNPPTGYAGLSTQDIGVDYAVTMFNNEIDIFNYNGDYVGSVSPTYTADSIKFTIPLALLGGDNGAIDAVWVLGDSWWATEWAPEVGHATIGSLNVPWLSESPITGTVSSDSSMPVQVVFDSNNLQPGLYTADIVVTNNDPDDLPIISATMTVEPSASMGWVEGVVTDEDTAESLLATLIAFGQPYTITTNPDTGYYKLWLEAGSYTLQVSADGYVSETLPIVITAQQGITQNVDLVLNIPILATSPLSWAFSQQVGQVTTDTLTIGNEGPATLEFQLNEINGEFIPQVPLGTVEMLPSQPPAPGTAAATHTSSTVSQPTVDLGKGNLSSSSIRILIAATDNSFVLQNLLSYYPDIVDVDYFDVQGDTPTLEGLSDYDVVLVWGNYGFADRYLMGDVLADYVDQGGTVIVSVFQWNYSDGSYNLGGRFVTDGYSPFESLDQGNHFTTANLGDYDELHLIMDGVTTVSDYYRDYVGLADGAELIASWDDGEEFVATKGNVVAINGYFGDNYNWSGDMMTILHNSMVYLVQLGDVSWITQTPITGTVNGYSTLPVQTVFDATGLQPGTYTAQIAIHNNTPSQGIVQIPITMTVEPTSSMGNVVGTVTNAWTGAPLVDIATVQLSGVYTVTADPQFSIWAEAGTYDLVAFAPGYITETYSINIPAGGTTTQNIPLIPAQPRLEGEPETLETTTAANTVVSQTFTLSNTGPMPLEYTLRELAPTLLPTTRTPLDLTGVQVLYDLVHGEPPLYWGNYSELVNDIISAGATITDNVSYPITAATLEGYDILWINCCGYTEWTSAELTAVSNWLEAGGALLIHGEETPATAGLATLYNISYQGGSNIYGASTVIEHPITVDVDSIGSYNYQSVTYTLPIEGVIFDFDNLPVVVAGQQNGGKVVVVVNDPLKNSNIGYSDNRLLGNNIFNWLAEPAYGDVPWYTTSPISGTIPPYSTQEITVYFDATGMTAGTYSTELAIEHTDPNKNSPVMVPVTLHVTEQIAAVSMAATTTTGSGYPGDTVVYTITVTNQGNGNDTFALSADGTWDAVFSANDTGVLAPGESFVFTVSIAIPPGTSGDESDTTAVIATSQLNSAVSEQIELTTNVTLPYIFLPIVKRP